ncbi:basic helix-loop-helix (bHLH) DNA-binding superfamily protein [Quillaja saponaria]|uniref:Basic helix-loop-helix (BHLH) DNA-binding superfamily protein n=1 Tax=Quillaja saponaria TaxID=32244 RepID=A0AAD7KPP9_QUISA|nr:basic helix-loop-helix (bHLH) DNA-binding superfamily protein [Quillaja saponaria]
MEKIYEELDEAKAEIEKLAGELKRKEELSEGLKKSHNMQNNEIQEARLKIDKLGQELSEKAEEATEIKQMNEDLKCSLYEKDSNIKHEANEKAQDREQQLYACREEIKSLKGCLSASKKKWVEADRKVKSFNELRERDDLFDKLEEEKRKIKLDSTECHYAKSQVDCLTSQHDKDIADLRHSLKSKETYYKDMEYQNRKLEQENQELRVSIKELQEAQIQQAGSSSSSLSKLRNQLRNLEQMYRNCTSILKAKEAEWSSQLEKLKADLTGYRSLLESKTETIEELKMELERSYSLHMQLKLQNEEMAMMIMVLNMGISEAQLKLANAKNEMDLCKKEREEEFCQIVKQLEMKNVAVPSADIDIDGEHEKATKMLEESKRCQLLLKEKVLQIASNSPEKFREVSDALERENIELAERIYEGTELELELQIWKSIAERLQKDLEENHLMRKELETSLLEQVDVGETFKQEKDGMICMLEEKERIIDTLQQRVVLLEQGLKVGETESSGLSTMETSPDSDKVRFLQIIREKDKILEELQTEAGWQEQQSFGRELESDVITRSSTEKTFEHEKDNLIQLVNGKNLRIAELIQQVKSLEEKFNSSLVSLYSQLAEKQAEIDLVHEDWERITAAEILAVLEIEEKKLMIEELEDDINNIQQKLKLQEEAWCHSEKHVLEMETKLTTSDAMLNKLKIENRNLLEDITKLSSERENLLGFVVGLGDKIYEFSTSDTQLMDMVGRLVQSFETNCPGMDLKSDDEFRVKDNVNTHSSNVTKTFEVMSDARSPFRVLN